MVHTTPWAGVEPRWRSDSTSIRGLSPDTPLQASHAPVHWPTPPMGSLPMFGVWMKGGQGERDWGGFSTVQVS